MRGARRRVPLTRLRKQRGGVFYGKPLTVSAPAQERYTAGLARAVTAMVTACETDVRQLYRDHAPHLAGFATDASAASQARILLNALNARFVTLFGKLAPGLAAKMTADVNAHSKSNLHASLREASGGLSLKTSIITGSIADAMKASIANNVALIKSIPQEYFTKLQGEVFTSIQQGQGLKDVLGAVEHLGRVTHTRARLIARDQTSKATTSLNEARMKALGVKEFEWLHSAGGHEPRPLHIGTLNHKIFRFDDLPIIDEHTGERGLPGQLINCRCRMIPVIKFGTDDAAS